MTARPSRYSNISLPSVVNFSYFLFCTYSSDNHITIHIYLYTSRLLRSNMTTFYPFSYGNQQRPVKFSQSSTHSFHEGRVEEENECTGSSELQNMTHQRSLRTVRLLSLNVILIHLAKCWRGSIEGKGGSKENACLQHSPREQTSKVALSVH